MPPSEPRKLNLLLLHGYTQSGPLFRAKTRALEKNLAKHFPAAPKPGSLPLYPDGIQFHYANGPHVLLPADIPTFDNAPAPKALDAEGAEEARAWWRRKDLGDGRVKYEGLEESLAYLVKFMREHGPFDGVVGFSQGACCAIALAALLEEGRLGKVERGKSGGFELPESMLDSKAENGLGHPALKLAVSYSGFRVPAGQGYDAIYEGGVETNSLHVIGSVDTVVSEERSLESVEACRQVRTDGEERHRVFYHPGGHFVPASQKPSVDALVQFIRDTVGGKEAEEDGEEERVEDMDMPF
ncbi:hypothetical protein K461DRAFT_290014 [Myriangium duriaei CBS 260.36]|uniref:Serine hydrolase domain-containing protein n=1 Tax=Myriangium duriaei CBS 260.36 TaxID=1168546 RepID=A0A9P4MPY4_9PEZI|nr:hypothetical protein K461DRAFT_290014 [Myriangium duriaei CBS 260.36]